MDTQRMDWLTTLITAGLLAFLTPACATVQSALGPAGPSEEEAKAAYEAGELKKLEEWCAERESTDPYSESRARTSRACNYAKRLERERARAAALETFEENLTCDGAAQAYADFVESDADPTRKQRGDAFMKAGKKLASCEEFDAMFGELMAHGVFPASSTATNRDEYELLETLTDDGVEVEAKLRAFSEGNKFQFEGSQNSAIAIVTYLEENEIKDRCETFVSALQSDEWDTLKPFIGYFGWTKCRAAGETIASFLKTGTSGVREYACRTLGRIGDPAHKDIMEKVAERDGEVKIVGDTKVYPVRDACSGALIKLDDE